jgi:tRNA (guanine-N7-)-methyltransferase
MANLRKIQSFVKRSGRLTASQEKGLTQLWGDYAIEPQGVLDFAQIFGNVHDVVLEIGFGNGDTLVEMAQDNPELNYVGIEVYEAGIGRLINSTYIKQLSNVKVMRGDAIEFLNDNIADNSLARFQLFFPDPWHKKKHHKRRIVQQDFLNLLTKKLKVGSICHMATDWQDYAEHMMNMLEMNKNFKNTQNNPTYSPRPEYRPITKFERRGRRLGHGVWDLIFINEKNS